MPTITLKNIPADIYENLKRSAELNRRSLNSEIIHCLEQALGSHIADPQVSLAAARRLRERTAGYHITDDEFDQAKRAGRL